MQLTAVRCAAALALERIGPDAIPALARGLGTKARDRVVHSLGRMGEVAIPVIMRALQDPNPNVRVAAARALAIGRHGVLDKAHVAPLIQTLGDEKIPGGVHEYIATVLVDVGLQVEEAVPLLAEVLEDDRLDVRSRAGATDGPSGIVLEEKRLTPDHLKVLHYLVAIGLPVDEAVPLLAEANEDDCLEVLSRFTAARVLSGIVLEAKQLTPDRLKVLAEKWPAAAAAVRKHPRHGAQPGPWAAIFRAGRSPPHGLRALRR